MSYDLILKRSNINWARGGAAPAQQPAAPAAMPAKFTCTPEEKAKLAKIAAVKAAAQKGDKKASAQWQNLLAVGIPALKARAAKGDPKAKRDLQCLKASGLFAAPAAVRGDFIGVYGPAAAGHVRQLIQLARQGNRRAQGILSASRISWVQGEFIGVEDEYKRVNLTSQEIAHIQDLQNGFIKKFNESYSTGNPFRNPLTNLDMAWLYKMATKEKKTSVDDWLFLQDKYAEPFLEQIDNSLQKLRDKGIPIVGEAPPKKSHGKSSGEFIGAYPTQILGSDLNDDELAVAREGGPSERQALARVRGDFIGHGSEIGRRRRRGGTRSRHLKQIVKRAAQGDTNALAQMQQVQQRLGQRAAAGDPRANTLLQRISQWYSQYQAQYSGTAQTQYPAYPFTTPYQQPYQTPYQSPGQPYSPYPGAPGAPADDEQELAATDPEL